MRKLFLFQNNASRKKRKIDVESLNESEDGEDDKPRKNANDSSGMCAARSEVSGSSTEK